MQTARRTTRYPAAVIVLVAAAVAVLWSTRAAPVRAGEFSRTTIDLGCVVSDVERAVKFYTEAIGFKQVGKFSVAAPFARDAGLTDGKALDIIVLALGEEKSATKLKLMQVDADSKKGDNAFIHSQLGFSYLTIYVADIEAAKARLKKAGVKPRGKTPISLPVKVTPPLHFILVADPDGNLIELIGPKK